MFDVDENMEPYTGKITVFRYENGEIKSFTMKKDEIGLNPENGIILIASNKEIIYYNIIMEEKNKMSVLHDDWDITSVSTNKNNNLICYSKYGIIYLFTKS